MPPRLLLQLPRPFAPTIDAFSPSIPSFLLPFLHVQSRNASILSSLSDRPGAYSRRIRRGRGPASGKGGKSGRGSDGQKQHSKVPEGFNGGQTPEHIVHGKYGFKNLHATEMSPVNLDRIQEWIEAGRLDPSKPITLKELLGSRAIHGIKDGIKLLGNGAASLKTPIHIVVSKASQSAIAAVEALGGTVTTRFYTPQAIHRIRSLEMHPYISMKWDQTAIGHSALFVQGADQLESRVKAMGFQYRLPDPTGRKDLEYYRDAKNRGYLAHSVQEGQIPSLYFKPAVTPEQIKELKRKSGQSSKAKQAEVANKLW